MGAASREGKELAQTTCPPGLALEYPRVSLGSSGFGPRKRSDRFPAQPVGRVGA